MKVNIKGTTTSHLKQLNIKQKDHDIWRWKSKVFLGTGNKMWRYFKILAIIINISIEQIVIHFLIFVKIMNHFIKAETSSSEFIYAYSFCFHFRSLFNLLNKDYIPHTENFFFSSPILKLHVFLFDFSLLSIL